MGTQREAEEFITKAQELISSNKILDIYFSLYKSKVERIHSNANFRKYNEFPSQKNNMGLNNMNNNKYKSFNGN